LKFIEKSALERADKAKQLIEKYHADSEAKNLGKVEFMVKKEKGEVLFEIEEENYNMAGDPILNTGQKSMSVKVEEISPIRKVQNMEVDDSTDNPYRTEKVSERINLLKGFQGSGPVEYQLEARDIVLYNYLMKNQLNSQRAEGEAAKNSDFVDAYLSTPQFINSLTELSNDVMRFTRPEEKRAFVKKGLCEINKRLPAQVYIPFVNSSMRNHAVLNIVVEDAVIFQTKERAPLLLCFEVF